MFELVCLYDFGNHGSSHPDLFYKKGFVKIFVHHSKTSLLKSLFLEAAIGSVLLKKDVLENVAKFTGKHLC